MCNEAHNSGQDVQDKAKSRLWIKKKGGKLAWNLCGRFFTKILWEMCCKKRIINPVPTNLKGDENCAGTDGEGNHSHEGTHDEVWMKNLFLQRDRRIKFTDTVKSKV